MKTVSASSKSSASGCTYTKKGPKTMKAYLENWSDVYEPAEGGYYVPVSSISYWRKFDSVEDCRRVINEITPHSDVTEWPESLYRVDDGFYDDGEQRYDYLPSIIEFVLEGEGQNIYLIADEATSPAPKTYAGYR